VLAVAVMSLLVSVLKAWTGRTGPGSLDRPAAYPGLYPSGHAATTAVAFGLAALLLLPYLRRSAARRLLVAAAVLVNLSVGWALVRCGYHWPLDVAGSWLLSGALLTGVALAVRSWSGSPG
jgi:membrane-associated phospholipid phosphatase